MRASSLAKMHVTHLMNLRWGGGGGGGGGGALGSVDARNIDLHVKAACAACEVVSLFVLL